MYVTLVFLHVLGAAVWLGGSLCMAVVTVPAIGREVDRLLAAKLTRRIEERFRRIGWSCLILLVLTGLLLMYRRGTVGLSGFDATPWLGSLRWLLEFKLALVGVMLILCALHDFVLAPRVLALLSSDHPDLSQAGRRRRTAAWMLRVSIALCVSAVACGLLMSRCHR